MVLQRSLVHGGRNWLAEIDADVRERRVRDDALDKSTFTLLYPEQHCSFSIAFQVVNILK